MVWDPLEFGRAANPGPPETWFSQKMLFSEMYGNDDEMMSFALYCGTPCPCFGQSHILQPELKQGKCIVRPESSSIACGSPTAAIQLLPP